MSKAKLNRLYKEKNVELVKCDGYFYFVYDCDTRFETHSVYVNAFSQLPFEMWIQEAEEFLRKINAG